MGPADKHRDGGERPLDDGPADPVLDSLEFWLDRAFRLPGTDIRFGLDGILGLLPFVGDTATAAISSGIAVAAWRRGARKRTIVKMAGNVALDWAIGTIPLVGDFFDFGFKANTRNLRLLREESRRRK